MSWLAAIAACALIGTPVLFVLHRRAVARRPRGQMIMPADLVRIRDVARAAGRTSAIEPAGEPRLQGPRRRKVRQRRPAGVRIRVVKADRQESLRLVDQPPKEKEG